MNLDSRIEQALMAPCMDAVIAVTERYQYLDEHREARVFTAYRELDHTLCVGFAETMDPAQRQLLQARGFVMFGEREGTKREHRLLLMTLKEIGFDCSYGPQYFSASKPLLKQLKTLGWPLGRLKALISRPLGSKDGRSSPS